MSVRRSAVSGLAFLLLLLSHSSPAQKVGTEVWIYTTDDIVLDARIVKPLGFPPSGGFPGMILIHGYGGNKDIMYEIQIAIAAYGYASLAYSVRGQGRSGGLSTVGGDRERRDLLEVIQYFRSTQDIDPGKLGVAGGSQGGIHSWMAAAHRMPGVRAVAPLIATPDFARTFVPNGCVRVMLPKEMTVSTVRYSPDRDKVRDFIIADRHDSILVFIDARDLERLVKNVQIPVLQGLGWGDVVFPANGGIRAAADLAARKIPIWSHYGTNGHGMPINPYDAVIALEKLVSWFDHWLKGFSLENDSVPMVFYADHPLGFPEHTAKQWPPPGSRNLRFYLNAGGLSSSPPAPTASASFPFSLTYDSTYTPSDAWNDMYAGPRFVQSFQSQPLRFLSPALSIDVEVTGIPAGRIVVRSAAGKFQVHVRFFDVSDIPVPNSWFLFSRSIHGVRKNPPGQIHEIEVEGTAISRVIRAGHRLGVEITSLDMLEGDQANTIPYFGSTEVDLLISAASPSYLDIPTVQGPTWGEGEPGSSVPDGFALEQNYPNPFNPATTISARWPEASDVKLVVFDLLGREVAKLAEGRYPAGKHQFTFDADNLPSGLYLYRLNAGRYSEARKMLLVR